LARLRRRIATVLIRPAFDGASICRQTLAPGESAKGKLASSRGQNELNFLDLHQFTTGLPLLDGPLIELQLDRRWQRGQEIRLPV
jgi:hypothetical protein